MTDREGRPAGSAFRVLVNAWKLYRSLAATAKKTRGRRQPEEADGFNAENASPEPAAAARTGALLVIGASVVWKATKTLGRVLLTRPAEPGTPAEEGVQTEEQKARTGRWLLLGALLSWKAGKSLARKTAETFLDEPTAGGEGAAPVLELRKQPETQSAGESGAVLADWEELKASAAAVGHTVEKVLSEATPAEDLPSSGREADRDLDRDNEVNLERRYGWGTMLAGFASLAGIAGGIAFVVNFWTGGHNQWLGGSLAVFLLGFGAALVLWAHWLTAHKEAVEPRERVSSPPPEQRRAAREFRAGADDIQRRRLLVGMGAAGMGVVGAVMISLIRSLGFPPYRALDTDVWKRGQRLMTVDGIPVSVDALQPGGMTIVFPENSVGSEKTQTVLVRVRQDLVQLPEARSDWAPGGNLAYSRICTHAGCSVGMYEANSHLLMCPCHQSTFDVLNGAQPTGGPAARALPQLPLYVDGSGHLRAAGGFSDYPGPGFWGMPS